MSLSHPWLLEWLIKTHELVTNWPLWRGIFASSWSFGLLPLESSWWVPTPFTTISWSFLYIPIHITSNPISWSLLSLTIACLADPLHRFTGRTQTGDWWPSPAGLNPNLLMIDNIIIKLTMIRPLISFNYIYIVELCSWFFVI